MFKRVPRRGFQIQTAREQVQANECPAVTCEETDFGVAGAACVPSPKLRARDGKGSRAETGSGGIIRQQCGGGYRVRRVSASY